MNIYGIYTYMIKNFDYVAFSDNMYEQAKELLPPDIPELYCKKILDTIKRFTIIAGENLINENGDYLTDDNALMLCQIIAEWTFHKGIDLSRSTVSSCYWDSILQKIAFMIYEVAKVGFEKEIPQQDLLDSIEHQVKRLYEECIAELNKNGDIDKKTLNWAKSQSNIDKMSKDILKTKIIEAIKMGAKFCFIQYWIFFVFRMIHKIHRNMSTIEMLFIIIIVTFLAGVVTYFVSFRKENNNN